MINNFPRGWDLKNISEIGTVSTSSVDKLSKPGEKSVKLINYMDVFSSLNKKITSEIDFMKVTARESQLVSNQVNKGDVLFTPSSETPNDIGISAVVFEELPETLYSYHLVRLKFIEEFNLNYKCYMFNSPDVLKQFERLSQGLTRYTISLKAFNEIQVLVPPINEQKKIAEILSTVDESIEKTDAIIEETRQLKKGLMQKLFTEGIGHTRFKDTKIGRIPEKWEILLFKDVFDFISTSSHSKNQMTYDETESKIFNIHYGAIHTTYKEPILDFNKYSIPKITDDSNMPKEHQYLKSGDLVIVDASEDTTGLGECVELKNTNDKKVIGGLHTYAVRDKNGKTIEGFRGYIFKNYNVKKILMSYSNQSKVYGITKKSIGEIPLIIPTIKEQYKFAEILFEVDAKIEKEETTKAELEQLKNGLMQVLLSGKVRVKA